MSLEYCTNSTSTCNKTKCLLGSLLSSIPIIPVPEPGTTIKYPGWYFVPTRAGEQVGGCLKTRRPDFFVENCPFAQTELPSRNSKHPNDRFFFFLSQLIQTKNDCSWYSSVTTVSYQSSKYSSIIANKYCTAWYNSTLTVVILPS